MRTAKSAASPASPTRSAPLPRSSAYPQQPLSPACSPGPCQAGEPALLQLAPGVPALLLLPAPALAAAGSLAPLLPAPTLRGRKLSRPTACAPTVCECALPIAAEDLPLYCHSVRHHRQSLSTAKLRKANLTDLDIHALATALTDDIIVRLLDLSHNLIGDKGAAALARMLRTNRTITVRRQ